MSTHNIQLFNIKKKVTLNYPKPAAIGFCSKRLKEETPVASKPLVFEPLKFYCISLKSS